MKLNKEQKKQLADFFNKFALAIATATAVRLLFDVNATPEIIYVLAAVVIIVMLILSMLLLKDADSPHTPTEVRKGIFHIHTAEIHKP